MTSIPLLFTLLLSLSSRLALSSPSVPASRLRVVLLRHGESENNVLNEVSNAHYRENRFADPKLTTLGHRQAEATAAFLTSPSPASHPLLADIDHIYVSPFSRTCETALPLVKATGKPATVWSDIWEVSGCYDGAGDETVGVPGPTADLIEERFGYDTSHMEEGGGGFFKLPKRETYGEAVDRITGVAARLRAMAEECAETGQDKTICLVCHGDFIDIILNVLLRMKTNPLIARFRTYNTSLSAIDIFGGSGEGMCALLFSNFHEHMAGDLCKKEKLGLV